MAKATVGIILILSLASAVGLFALSPFRGDWQSAAQAQAPDAGANEDDAQPDRAGCSDDYCPPSVEISPAARAPTPDFWVIVPETVGHFGTDF